MITDHDRTALACTLGSIAGALVFVGFFLLAISIAEAL